MELPVSFRQNHYAKALGVDIEDLSVNEVLNQSWKHPDLKESDSRWTRSAYKSAIKKMISVPSATLCP